MKSSVFVIAAAIVLAASARAESVSVVRGAAAVKAPVHHGIEGALQTFTDAAEFAQALGDSTSLALESFDGGTVDDGETLLCDEPASSNSNDACFVPGTLVSGFSMSTSSGIGLAMVGAGLFGAEQATPIIETPNLGDFLRVAFDQPANALSMQVYGGFVASEIVVEAFDDSDMSLGTVTVSPAAADVAAFAGFIGTTAIARVSLSSVLDGAVGLDDLRFSGAGGGDDLIFASGFDPLSCTPVQLLDDPGFEATDISAIPYTNPFWNGSSTHFETPFCDATCGSGDGTAGPRSGDFWTWLGGAGGATETATASQAVVIPVGAVRFLNLWLWIGAIGDGSSSLDVAIDGDNVMTFDEPVAAEADYTQRSADISAYADGNSHTLQFTYTSPTTVPSNYSLDDVTIDCAPAAISRPEPASKSPAGDAHRIMR